MSIKLQLALDGDLDSSLGLVQAVRPYIDIAEIGTPLVYREGIVAAQRLRPAFLDLTLLADFKIMDAGEDEAAIAFTAGCDLVTVLGVTQDVTLRGALQAAQRFDKQIMVDLMGVPDLPARAQSLQAMGCHYLCVHLAHDLQVVNGGMSTEYLQPLRQQLPDAPLAIAGGINLTNLEAVLLLNPAIIIVGSAIRTANDPVGVARAMHERIASHEHSF